MATNYSINYEDERFKQVENEKNNAINETTNTYNEMIEGSASHYQNMIDQSKEWANTQSELQQAQTDFTIDKINQQKDKAEKDYVKEQKGAYTDYQKATNQYGANAEQLASQGLNQTGYSESTRTSAFNTYQNRYMSARESYNQSVLNYDNAIKEAQLANNSALAQIAYEALQSQLELSLEGFQYKNTLVLQKLDAINSQEDRYYSRYQDVLSQINTENALAEQVRQYNEQMAFEKAQAAQQQANWEKEYALAKYSTYASGKSGGSEPLTEDDDTVLKEGDTINKEDKKAPVSKDTMISIDGKAYYQNAASAIAETGTSYSTKDALNKGLITSKIYNGITYYAPVKTSTSSNKSSYTRTINKLF